MACDRIYVSDLPHGINEGAVRDIFAAYGTLKWSKYLDGKNAALVQFETVDEATWIVDNLNGNIPQGLTSPIHVVYSNQGGGDSWGKNRFEPYGGKGGNQGGDQGKGGGGGGKGKGGGGQIGVLKKGLQYAGVLPGGRWSNDQNALCVRGLPADTTTLDLYEIFSPFGAMPSEGAYAMMREDGTGCRGLGFINFLSAQSCQNAMTTLNGTMMPDGTTLLVTPKQTKADRDAGKDGGKGKGW